jgi:type I restriction enzyme S subunit
MFDIQVRKLAEVESSGEVELGRGEVISNIDLAAWPGNYPVYSSSAAGEGEFGRYGKFMFDEELITWSIDGGGKPFYRRKHKFSVTNVSGFLRIKRGDKWNYQYLHALLSKLQAGIQFDYQMKAHPSVIRELYELRWVPITEQQKIAKILDTLDTQIRQTEALIAKLVRIKQGLLTDLLTRGIDQSGQLRPTPDQAPHLYKDSPLGWIPKEWRVSDIDGLLSDLEPAMRSGPFGSALLKSELVESGIPLLGIDNVYAEQFRSAYSRFVTRQKFMELSRYAVRPHDLMITIMGTVGRCCLVPEYIGDALSSKHTWTITLDTNKYTPYLAMLQINHAPWALRHLARDEQGGIMSAIRSETLRSLQLPVPPIEEQKLISARLTSISQRIETEGDTAVQLKLVKQGLMDDLLTGRVRVTLLQDSAKPNHAED